MDEIRMGCELVLCVTSGDGFREGYVYPVLGNNNGIHILREKYHGRVNDPGGDSSDPYDFVAQTGGNGKGIFNNFDDSGSPSFIPFTSYDSKETEPC